MGPWLSQPPYQMLQPLRAVLPTTDSLGSFLVDTSSGVFPRPFSDYHIITMPVSLVDVCNLRNQRLIYVRVIQERYDRH